MDLFGAIGLVDVMWNGVVQGCGSLGRERRGREDCDDRFGGIALMGVIFGGLVNDLLVL